MKLLLPTIAAGLLLGAAGIANADDVVVVPSDSVVVAPDDTTAAIPGDTVIVPEQQTVIREYVHKNPLASIKLPGVELNLGSRLPDTVELHEVPNVKYRYVVIDGQTVLVDPDTHEIVEVLQ